ARTVTASAAASVWAATAPTASSRSSSPTCSERRPCYRLTRCPTSALFAIRSLHFSRSPTIPVGQTIEVDSSGTQGNNDANAMQTFVTNGGLTSVTHPTWGVYRDVYLIMWKQANAGGQVWNSASWTTW